MRATSLTTLHERVDHNKQSRPHSTDVGWAWQRRAPASASARATPVATRHDPARVGSSSAALGATASIFARAALSPNGQVDNAPSLDTGNHYTCVPLYLNAVGT